MFENIRKNYIIKLLFIEFINPIHFIYVTNYHLITVFLC